MGNQQSTLQQQEEAVATQRLQKRQPTKLTKPRTNTSTSNLLLNGSTASRQNSKLELPLPPPLNKRASTLTIDVVENDDSARPSGEKAPEVEKKARRRSLFRSKTTQPVETSLVEVVDEKATHEEQWLAPLHRYSSLGALTYESLGDAKHLSELRPPLRNARTASVRPYATQSSRLSEIVEARSPSPQNAEVVREMQLRPEDDRGESMSKTSTHTSTLPERSNSDHSTNGTGGDSAVDIPIRRRSLQTPGIATRQSSRQNSRQSSRDDPYRKSLPAMLSFESFQPIPQIPYRKPLSGLDLPSKEELRQYYYDPSKPAESPLDELAQMDELATESRRLSLLQPRTHTPDEMEYAHIGSFKLGSLRITNGTASPGPAAMRKEDDDVEGQQDEGNWRAKEQKRLKDNPYRKTFDPAMLRNFVNDDSDRFASKAVKEIKPVRDHSDLVNTKQDLNPGKTVTTTLNLPDLSFQLFDFGDVPAVATPKSPDRARELAQSYMEEIASSPFSFEDSPPATPRLETRSKHTATEDHLFEDDLDSPALLQSALSGFAISDLNAQARIAAERQKAKNAVVQTEEGQKSGALMKVDSGYSSNSSLRSLRRRKSANEGVAADMNAPGLPEKTPPTPPPKVPLEKQELNSVNTLPSRRASQIIDTPPTPPKEGPVFNGVAGRPRKSKIAPRHIEERRKAPSSPPPPPPNRQAPPTPPKSNEDLNGQISAKKLNIRKAEMPKILNRQSLPAVPTRVKSEELLSQFSRTPLAREPAQSPNPIIQSSKSQTNLLAPTKQQKNDILVQGLNDVHSGDIPPVPSSASRALDERIRQYPTSLHTLNPNLKSIRREDSKETLATILSMASAEQQAEESYRYDSLARVYQNLPPGHARQVDRSRSRESLNFPGQISRSNSRNVTPQISRRQSMDEFSYPPSRGSSRGRSRTPSQTDEQAQNKFENQITSFLGVSDSLGSSPYDAAIQAGSMSGTPSKSKASPNIGPTSTPKAMKRATIQIGMDSPAASLFARERSRQRSLSRRASWDRPVTATPDASGFSSSPPVPNLPTNLLDGSPAAKIKKTKSPPPVSLKGNVGRKGPPPPAWASLSSAAREKMMRVGESPPASPPILVGGGPRLSNLGNGNFNSPSPAPRFSPPLNAETQRKLEEKARQDQWEAQRRGWAMRRDNAAEGTNSTVNASGRRSVEFEAQPVKGQFAPKQQFAGNNVTPQSYFPPQPARNNTVTITQPAMETITSSISSFGKKSLQNRKSWDTSTATSVRGPPSTHSTYTESVYTNAGVPSTNSYTTTSFTGPQAPYIPQRAFQTGLQEQQQQQHSLSRAQSHNSLVDRTGSYVPDLDPHNPSSRRNSTDRERRAASMTAQEEEQLQSSINWLGRPPSMDRRNSNVSLYEQIVRRQASNSSLGTTTGAVVGTVNVGGGGGGGGNGSLIAGHNYNSNNYNYDYPAGVRRQASNGSLNGNHNYPAGVQRQASNGSLNGKYNYPAAMQRQASNGSLNGKNTANNANANRWHPIVQRQISNSSLNGSNGYRAHDSVPPSMPSPHGRALGQGAESSSSRYQNGYQNGYSGREQIAAPRWDEYESYSGYDGGYAAAAAAAVVRG